MKNEEDDTKLAELFEKESMEQMRKRHHEDRQ